MWRGLRRAPGALVAGLAVVAVASLAPVGLIGAPGAAGTAGASTSPATALHGCRPNPQGRAAACLGRSAGGHTVRVHVGREVEVDLRSVGLRWSGLRQVGPHLLRALGAVRQHAGKISATYTAVVTGRTTLVATGHPVCAPGRPCPKFILAWRVRVEVST